MISVLLAAYQLAYGVDPGKVHVVSPPRFDQVLGCDSVVSDAHRDVCHTLATEHGNWPDTTAGSEAIVRRLEGHSRVLAKSNGWDRLLPLEFLRRQSLLARGDTKAPLQCDALIQEALTMQAQASDTIRQRALIYELHCRLWPISESFDPEEAFHKAIRLMGSSDDPIVDHAALWLLMSSAHAPSHTPTSEEVAVLRAHCHPPMTVYVAHLLSQMRTAKIDELRSERLACAHSAIADQACTNNIEICESLKGWVASN